MLIHKVAKMRTAEDIAAGLDVSPEATYVSQVKLAPAVLPMQANPVGDGVAAGRTTADSIADDRSTTGTTGAHEVR